MTFRPDAENLERPIGWWVLPPLASVILGVLILAGGVWLGLHAGETKVGLRGLLGLFLAGGLSIRIGLAGLSKKRRRRR